MSEPSLFPCAGCAELNRQINEEGAQHKRDILQIAAELGMPPGGVTMEQIAEVIRTLRKSTARSIILLTSNPPVG